MSSKDFWDQRYNTDEFVYGIHPNDFLMSVMPKLKGKKRVLCLAEGEGRNAVFLAEQGFDVTALDISQVAVEKGQRLAKQRGVEVNWLVTDLADYSFERSGWDLIVAVFMHLPSELRQQVFHKIPASLSSGGAFIGEFYRKEQLQLNTGGPKDLDMLYCPELLQKEIQPLECCHLNVINREVIEGIGHTGMAAVVQIMAIKSDK